MSSTAVRIDVPVIREASFEDHPQIAALESKYGLVPKSFAEWTHLWLANPTYTAIQDKWPIGWVLAEGKQVVGYFGNIPLAYEYNGRSITVATGRSWAVAPHYRTFAPLLLEQFFNQPNVELCLTTTANLNASRVLTAIGALPVPVGAWDQSEVWITKHWQFSRSWLRNRKFPASWAWVLAPALLAKAAFSRARLPAVVGTEVEHSTAFDARFDEFWEDLRAQKRASLLAVRTRRILEWHFKQPLARNQVWILSISRGTRLRAYAIFLERRNPATGTGSLLLVDFQALDGDEQMISPILASALQRSKQQNLHSVEKIGLSIGSGTMALAPHRRKRGFWSYYYKSNDGNLSEMLKNPGAWSPSLLDGDATL